MGLRAKSTFRVLILVGGAILVGAAGTGFILYTKNKRAKENAYLRETGLKAAKDGEIVEVVNRLGSYLANKGNDVKADDVEVLKAYTAARMKLPDIDGEYLRDAKERYRELISLAGESESFEFRRELLKIYGSLGMGTEAVKEADTLLKRDPKDTDAMLWKARGLLALRKADDALKCVQDALAIDRLSPAAVDMAVMIMAGRGDKPDDVFKWTAAQAKGLEDTSEAQYALTRGYLGVGDREAAKRAALKASANVPASAEFGLAVARMLENTEQFAEATSYLASYAPKVHDENFTNEYYRHLAYANRFDELFQIKGEGEAARQPTVLTALRAIAAFELKKREEGKALLAALEERGKRWDFAASDWNALLTLFYVNDKPRQRDLVDAAMNACRRNTREPFFRLYLGDAYSNAGDVRAALDQWLAAGARGLGWSRPCLRLAALYQSVGNPVLALARARDADLRLPNERETMVTIARAWAAALPVTMAQNYRDVGSPDALLAYISKIQAQFPGEETMLPLQVELLVRLDRKPAALALIDDMLKLKPGEVTLLSLAGVSVKMGLGREDAILTLNEQLRGGISPEDAMARCGVFEAKGQREEAKKFFVDARARAADKNSLAWNLMWCRLLEITADPQAAAEWKSLAALPAAQEDAQVLWAALFAGSSRKDHAFTGKLLDRLKALSGELGMQWRVEKSRWLLDNKDDRKDQEEAMKMLVEASRQWPNVAEIRELLAMAYENAANVQASNKEIITAAELEPQDARLKLTAGLTLLRHGDAVRAIAYLKGVADLPSASSAQKMQAGVLLAQAGEREVSTQLLEKTAGERPEAQQILAGLYWQSGRIADAEKAFNAALAKPTLQMVSQAASFFLAVNKPAEADRVLGLLEKIKLQPGEKEFVEGAHWAQRGQMKEAIDRLKKATAAAPGNGEAWRWLMATELKIGKIEDAIKTGAMARTALAEDPVEKTLTRSSPNVQKMLENDAARDYVINALLLPGQNAGVEDIAAAFSATGAVELAEKIAAVADRHRDVLPVQILAIRMKQAASQDYASRGQRKGSQDMLNDALSIAKRAMITSPNSPLPALYSAMCYAALGQWNESRQAAERWRANLITGTDDAGVTIAQLDMVLNRGKEAEELLQGLLKSSGPNTPQYRNILVLLAEAKLKQGQVEAAAALLWPLAKDDAEVRSAWCQLAAGLLPDAAQATNWLAKAEALIKPEDFGTRFSVGGSYLVVGYRFKDKAVTDHGVEMMTEASHAKEATKAQQEELAIRLAMAFEELNDLASAEKYYRVVLGMNEKADVAMNNLASVLAKRGAGLEEAVTLVRKAIALRPISNYYDTLGSVLQAGKQYDEALKALQKAMDLDPGNPQWMINAADVQLAAGRPEQARALLTRVDGLHLDFSKIEPEVKVKYDRVRAALPKAPTEEGN